MNATAPAFTSADIATLINARFASGDPRSVAFQQGFAFGLRHVLLGETLPRQYAPGSAAHDAYQFGAGDGMCAGRLEKSRREDL